MQSDDHPEERIVALLNLYNVITVPTAQHSVLLLACDFSRRNPRISTLLGGAVRGKADTWVKEWNLNQPQARDLLLALASVLKVQLIHLLYGVFARLRAQCRGRCVCC
jgi:hypothetical protein